MYIDKLESVQSTYRKGGRRRGKEGRQCGDDLEGIGRQKGASENGKNIYGLAVSSCADGETIRT